MCELLEQNADSQGFALQVGYSFGLYPQVTAQPQAFSCARENDISNPLLYIYSKTMRSKILKIA